MSDTETYQEKLSRAIDKYPELARNIFISEATIDDILEEDDKMTPDEMTHAQLLDEVKPTIKELRRTIRIARTLAVQMERNTGRYDHALSALGEFEGEIIYLVKQDSEA